MSRDCKHGSLARSCPVCELTAEIEKLHAKIDRLREYNGGLRDKNKLLEERVEELEEITNAVGIGPDTVLYGTVQDCKIASKWLATHTCEDEQIGATPEGK